MIVVSSRYEEIHSVTLLDFDNVRVEIVRLLHHDCKPGAQYHAGRTDCRLAHALIVPWMFHRIRIHRHVHHQVEECLALLQKKIVGRESLDSGHGAAVLR
jgi:hypothetical protein